MFCTTREKFVFPELPNLYNTPISPHIGLACVLVLLAERVPLSEIGRCGFAAVARKGQRKLSFNHDMQRFLHTASVVTKGNARSAARSHARALPSAPLRNRAAASAGVVAHSSNGAATKVDDEPESCMLAFCESSNSEPGVTTLRRVPAHGSGSVWTVQAARGCYPRL